MKIRNFQFAVILIVTACFACLKNENEVDAEIYNKWEITDFMSIESLSYTKIDNYNPTIEFLKDGSFKIKLDRNNCFGHFALPDKSKIEISPPGCTKMCCDSDFSNKFVLMLLSVTNYSIEGNKMKLDVPEWGCINLTLSN